MTQSNQSGQPYLLEVIVCSVEDAIAAKRGGADRLEVISHYEAGGLTPSIEMVREIAAKVSLPLRVMLRETEPFEVQDKREIERLCDSARAFASLEVDGLVLGFLKNREIDHDLVTSVLACAPKLNATFHRAFEDLADPLRAIAELKQHRQIDRILTSGGPAPWPDKVEGFAVWQRMALPEIQILVGGGTDAEVIGLLKPAGIREFHVGRSVREGEKIDGKVLADRVAKFAALLRKTLV